MKVSFDFDSTLATIPVQKYAKELLNKGIEVHIVTGRFEDESRYIFNHINHDYLFSVVDELGIKRENIHFMNMKDKYEFFLDNDDFIWHLDDDDIELGQINFETKVKCIWRSEFCDWEKICNNILNKKYEDINKA